MLEEPTARPTRLVPYIPVELQVQIKDHLDIQSARSLTSTCQSLRDIGEMRLYEDIDLTSGWSAAELDPLVVGMGKTKNFPARAEGVISRAGRAVAALKSYPLRVESVRGVRLEPYDGDDGTCATAMIAILHLVSSNLQRLALVPLPDDAIWQPDPPATHLCHNRFFDRLAGDRTKFPNLLHLKYAFPAQDPDDPVESCLLRQASWLSRQEGVEELDLCAYNCRSGPINLIFRDSSFINIRRLTFSRLDSDHIPTRFEIFATIILLAPHVEEIRFNGIWQEHASLNRALKAAKHLKTLIIAGIDDCGHHPTHMKLRPPGPERGVTHFAADTGELEETKFFRNFIHLHNMPDLQQLTIFVTPQMTQSGCHRPLDEFPSTPGYISARFIRHVQFAPSLTSAQILFIADPSTSIYEIETAHPKVFVAPAQWEAGGHRGLIIRHYLAKSVGRAIDEQLWCVRVLLDYPAWILSPSGYLQARKCFWRTNARYKGVVVPWDVLEAVLAETGDQMYFRVGGRNLKLDEEAWDILRRWRRSVGAEFSDDSGDDSD